MARNRELGEGMLRFGLALPGAHEDHPWGELVLKVKGKVFVFLGKPGDELRFSVKLPQSGERLLDQDWAEPTGYGLGKSGWVTVTVDERCALGAGELQALLTESYRAVAAKTQLKELDGGARGEKGAGKSAAKHAPKAAPVKKVRPARKG